MPAKRTKKYNPMKGALASANVGLRNLAVFHSQTNLDEGYSCIVLNYKRCKKVKVGQSMAIAMTEIKHKWNVHLLAIGLESNGKKRFTIDEVPICEPLFQHDLVDYLNERHKLLADEFKAKGNKLTNLAWLAVPTGGIVSTKEVENIIDNFKAW